jgi:hypothetical protein
MCCVRRQHPNPRAFLRSGQKAKLPQTPDASGGGLRSGTGAKGSRLGPNLAPEEGFEPPAKRLTVACSTTELLRIRSRSVRPRNQAGFLADDRSGRNILLRAYGRLSRRCTPWRGNGGPGRNRTDVRGFAVLCMATLPPGRFWSVRAGKASRRYRCLPMGGQGVSPLK